MSNWKDAAWAAIDTTEGTKMKLNAQKAIDLISNEATPYTVKSTLTSWLTNHPTELPEFIRLLNSVMEE